MKLLHAHMHTHTHMLTHAQMTPDDAYKALRHGPKGGWGEGWRLWYNLQTVSLQRKGQNIQDFEM